MSAQMYDTNPLNPEKISKEFDIDEFFRLWSQKYQKLSKFLTHWIQ